LGVKVDFEGCNRSRVCARRIKGRGKGSEMTKEVGGA